MVKAKEASQVGERISALVQAGQIVQAYTLLSPILAQRTPFAMLRRIAEAVGAGPLQAVNAFLEHVAADKTEGGWVVIARTLEAQFDRDLASAFSRCRRFIIAGDAWYAADILGEGVAGQALVARFQPALDLLAPWREDANRWVRRAAGVSVHFWAKRSRGAAEYVNHAEALLAFLEPTFEEWDLSVVKGVGWGLKTMGKYYPDLVSDWLEQQVVQRQRRHRTLILRKALTFLSEEQRARATGAAAK